MLAAWRAGLTVIALPFLWQRYEVATIAADFKPQALLGAGSFDSFSIAHGLREVAAKEMSVRFVLGFGADLPDASPRWTPCSISSAAWWRLPSHATCPARRS